MRWRVGLGVLAAGAGVAWVVLRATPRPENVLIVVLDDVGVEVLGTYGLDAGAVPTPALDRLAMEGVTFTRAYAMPSCSPTRAALLTGRYPGVFGLGNPINLSKPGEVSLPDSALTLPEVLQRDPRAAWTSALVGKWHLTTIADDALGAPLRQGFDRFVGTLGNLQGSHALSGKPQDYFDWELVRDGAVVRERRYATTVLVDEAVRLARTLPEPWLIVLSLHGAHTPYLPAPPAVLWDGDREALEDAPTAERFRAVVRATDAELGRLQDALVDRMDRTHLVVVGDNGTDGRALPPSLEHRSGKSTVRELGVRVPLVVAGPGVKEPGRRVDHLVHVVDVLPTVLDLVGFPEEHRPAELDGRSFAPVLGDPVAPLSREVVFAEFFEPNGLLPPTQHARMVRGERYKLILKLDGTEELWEMKDRWLEGEDLMRRGSLKPEAERARDLLRSRLEEGRY